MIFEFLLLAVYTQLPPTISRHCRQVTVRRQMSLPTSAGAQRGYSYEAKEI